MGRHGENIRKRKDGRWEARFIESYGMDGKAKYRYIYGQTYLEAKRKRKAAMGKASQGNCNSRDSKSTFEQIAVCWLENRKGIVKESTYANYGNILEKHMIPELGSIHMTDITTEQMERFLQNKQRNGRLDGNGGLSGKTVADLRAVLKLILQYACLHGYPDAAKIILPSMGSSAPEAQTLSLDEQKKLDTLLFSVCNPLHSGILLSLYGGLRIGEVCALQWRDIHFDSGTVDINKTLLRIRDLSPDASAKTKLLVDTPKTQCSNRTIPLPDFLLSYLWSARQEPEIYLLTGTNRFMEPRVCLHKYKKVLQSAGIHDHTFHALRHTFATRCIENGVDIKSLSEIMGHASVSITMQRYVHPSMELKREQINKLSASSIHGQKCGQITNQEVHI